MIVNCFYLSSCLFVPVQRKMSEMGHQFFLIFCMKVESQKVRKRDRAKCLEKRLLVGRTQKVQIVPPKCDFEVLTKICSIYLNC